MKEIENLKRLFKLNNHSEYSQSPIFKDFIRIKKAEKDLEDILNSDKELTFNEKIAIEDINDTLCKESYYSYFKQTFPVANPLILGEHIELICDILTLAERGLFKDIDSKSRIAISIPPRHLKSTCITNCFPSWFMGRASWRNTIVTSYGDNLVQKAGQKNREWINELAGRLFDVKLRNDVSQKAMWELKGGGRFKGSSIRGAATGEGAELLIIDDPVKNRQEAISKTIQESIFEEYNFTFASRVHQNGIIVLIMTRWHNADLRGKIEETEKDLNWIKLDLMAICETEEEAEQDALGRKVGQALYPQMYDEKYFIPFKLNPRAWWSLYKQKPQTDSGEYFKREYFQYFEFDEYFVTLYTEQGKKQFLLKDCWFFSTIDTAQKDKQENDETGIITFGVTPEYDILVGDVFHARIEVPDQEKAIDQNWQKFDLRFQAIEDKQSGTGIIQKLQRVGRPVEVLKAIGDKIERAGTAVLYYANGKVYHLKGAPWLSYFENQLINFPVDAHDDLVDCTSYGCQVVANKGNVISVV